MAEHSSTGSPMDYHEHERTYSFFLQLSGVVVVWALIIVVGLGIGGTSGRWWLAGFWMLAGTLISALGLAIKGLGFKGGAVVLVMMLATLALVNQ